MLDELNIFNDVARRLNLLDIPYMLTGSLAMSFYATPRMTRDIDIVIELDSIRLESFINMFNQDFYISAEAVKDSIENEFLFNIIHLETSIKVDFIIKKNIEYRQVEFDRRKLFNETGINGFLVSKEDLIISKLFWFKESESEMQKRDVKNLLSSGFDEKYLSYWVKRLDLSIEFTKVNNE